VTGPVNNKPLITAPLHCIQQQLREKKNKLTVFFTRRTHQTRVGLCLSDVAELLSGVLQWSGVGPVLFLIYINGVAGLLEHNGIIAR